MPFVDAQQARLYYEVHGPDDAPAIVLAHGTGGNTLIWWQSVPHFARAHRVVVFDHRGFGRSTCEPDAYRPERFGEDLRAILDAERIERAAIVCQSMGGWTGVQASLQDPQRVRCLVLGGTPGGVWTPGVAKCFGAIAERLAAEGVRASAALAPDFPRREPELTLLYDQISALNPQLDASGMARITQIQLGPKDFAGWNIPTRMLVGEQDHLFSVEALTEVSRVIPGAELLVFPGVGHSLYFEDPGTFHRMVDELLAEHP